MIPPGGWRPDLPAASAHRSRRATWTGVGVVVWIVGSAAASWLSGRMVAAVDYVAPLWVVSVILAGPWVLFLGGLVWLGWLMRRPD